MHELNSRFCTVQFVNRSFIQFVNKPFIPFWMICGIVFHKSYGFGMTYVDNVHLDMLFFKFTCCFCPLITCIILISSTPHSCSTSCLHLNTDQTNVLDLPLISTLPWKSLAFTTSTIFPNITRAFPLYSDPCFWRSWPGLPLAPHPYRGYQQSC